MKSTILLALISPCTLAAPTIETSSSIQTRDIPRVGLGQQIQLNYERHELIVWSHSKSACPKTRTIRPLISTPRGKRFIAPGTSEVVQFCSCDGQQDPLRPLQRRWV